MGWTERDRAVDAVRRPDERRAADRDSACGRRLFLPRRADRRDARRRQDPDPRRARAGRTWLMSRLRVSGGEARGRHLKAPKNIRPTQGMVKQDRKSNV